MAGTNILGAASVSPQTLVSQLLGINDTALYTVPASSSVKVAHGTLCNVTASMPAPVLTLGTLGTVAGVTAPTISLGATGTPLAAPALSAPTTATTGGTLAAATYYYKATYTNATGETVGSNEISQVTTGTTSTVTFTIGAAPAGATGTKIYRSTAAGSEAILDTLTTTPTTYTDTGSKTPGSATVPTSNTTAGGTFAAATYYWKVTTLTTFGETAGSNELSAAIAANGTQVINWSAITNATGYKVYRGTAAGSENVLVTTLGTVTTYTDTGAAGSAATVPSAATSSTQYWKVSALNSVGETLGSNEVTASVPANGNAPLSWPAVPGAVSYNVYRGTTAGGENVQYNTTATSFTDTGAAGTTKSPVTAATTATAVTVYLSVLKSGSAVGDNTHRVISSYSLAANDTLSLRDYIAGTMLGPGDIVAAYASTAGSVTAVITGTVHA